MTSLLMFQKLRLLSPHLAALQTERPRRGRKPAERSESPMSKKQNGRTVHTQYGRCEEKKQVGGCLIQLHPPQPQ